METPCPRCGTLKTESVRHGFIYNTLWKMGYHLRRCSFCNRRRLIARGDRNRPHPNDLTAEELTEHFNRRIASSLKREGAGVIVKSVVSDSPLPLPRAGATPKAVAVVSSPPPKAIAVGTAPSPAATAVGVAEMELKDVYGSCPECGNTKYRRSRRRWYERWLNRPRMARCLKCSCRYPYPD
jgi:hypothetical protein